MRNLKRALSLAMASVMTLGMMTVGASAKGIADFSDAAEITNADAVAVTSAVGIFKGYDDGEFKGDNVVTRAEMAVICAKLLYGADVDPAQFAGTSSFTDTPAWAEGYINLCASLGIIAGRGNGIFDPSSTVSTVEAASMLTKTLGYFQNQKDYGSDWKLAVTAKATQLGLYGDLKLAADTGLTRDNVAELVFNTMTKAVPVDYNELLGVYYNQNQGIVYALEFNYLQTLGYKNFDLVYKTVEDGGMYGRPTIVWGTGHYDYKQNAEDDKTGDLDANGGLISGDVRMLDKNEIVTVAKDYDYIYTKDATLEQIVKDLGSKVLNYTWTCYVNGEKQTGTVKPAYINGAGNVVYNSFEKVNDKDEQYRFTDKGAVLEIYVDEHAGEVTLCEYNYYLGEVANVKSDEDGEYVNVKPLSAMENKDTNYQLNLDIKKFYTDELEKKDLVIFTVDENDDDETYIAEMFTPGSVTGEVTRVEKDKGSDDTYIRLDGESTKYFYTSKEHNVYDLNDTTEVHPELKKEYILYTTPTDYVLAFEPAEETTTQYLYVKDSDEEMTDWVAKVVLSDASTAKVEVKDEYTGLDKKAHDVDWMASYDKDYKTNIDELIWKYSVSDKGVYSLTEAKQDAGIYDINNGKSYMEEDDSNLEVLVDEDTIFVDTMNDKSYVGYSAVPNVENAKVVYALDKYNIAEIVYILDGDIYDKDGTYFMLTKDDHDSLKYDGDYYREYFYAYVNGEKKTLNVAYDALDADEQGLKAGVLYKALKTVDEEFITEVEVVTVDADYVGELISVGNNAFKMTDNLSNKVKFDTNADTDFVIVEAVYDKVGNTYEFDKWAISDGDISDLKDIMEEAEEDNTFKYTVAVVEETKNTAELVYVFVGKEFTQTKANTKVVLGENSNINNVEIAGINGALTYGDVLVLILEGDFDAAKAAVNSKFVDGHIYTVMVNGQACVGIGQADGTCQVIYTVMPSDIHGELVLNVGTVTYEKALSTSTNTETQNKVAEIIETFDDVIADSNIDVTDTFEPTVETEVGEKMLVISLDAEKADTGYNLAVYVSNNDTKTVIPNLMAGENKDLTIATYAIGNTNDKWSVKVSEYSEDIVSFNPTYKIENGVITVKADVTFRKALEETK